MIASARGRVAAVFALALFIGLALGGLAQSRTGYGVETQSLDVWFPLRYRFFGKQPIDPRIVLVGVDAQTMDKFGKPMLFWQADLANLISKIKQGQPAAVGLDFLISPKTEGLAPEDPLKVRLQDEAMQLALTALDGAPVILAELYANDEFSSSDKDQPGYEDDQVFSPHEVVRDLLQQKDGTIPAFGFANVPPDLDGTVRRMKLFVRQGTAQDAQPRPSNFAFRLLEVSQGKALDLIPGSPHVSAQLSWNGNPIPFLFDESFLLNFPGPMEENAPPGQPASTTLTFPIVSAAAVLDGSYPAQNFQGKVVIIAPLADTLGDAKVVPGDPSYPGAAVHATVLNMLLTNGFISRSPLLWFLLCGAGALLGVGAGRSGRVSLSLLGLLGLPLLSFLAFSLAGVWLPTIFTVLAFATGSLLGYIERLVTVERDRARVRATFGRMVSPQVMQHVLRDLHSLRHGVRKEITVLFTDINDFTPVCEKHEPEEVIQMLSEYFSLMVDVIMKYDGYLKQYVGDEIMVIFGAPDDREDHATRAVLTALEMRDVLAKAQREANGKPGFYSIKAGINTGSVVVGKVGPESRWEYAAVGDSVNLGARVMSAAQKLGLDLGVSEATRQRYQKEREARGDKGDPVTWISQGIQSFKGKISQMEVFAVQRDQTSSSDSLENKT